MKSSLDSLCIIVDPIDSWSVVGIEQDSDIWLCLDAVCSDTYRLIAAHRTDGNFIPVCPVDGHVLRAEDAPVLRDWIANHIQKCPDILTGSRTLNLHELVESHQILASRDVADWLKTISDDDLICMFAYHLGVEADADTEVRFRGGSQAIYGYLVERFKTSDTDTRFRGWFRAIHKCLKNWLSTREK